MTDWRSRVLELASDAEDAFDRRWDAFERRFGWDDPLRIEPYRGYQAPERLVFRGRVLEDKGRTEPAPSWRSSATWTTR